MKRKRKGQQGKTSNRRRIKKKIIQVLRATESGSMSIKHLAENLDGEQTGMEGLRSQIAELKREGRVRSTGDGRIAATSPSVRFEGKLQVHPSGFGFVVVDGFDRDIFVSKGKMGGAFHNDLVEIKVDKGRMGPRISGRITDVVERGMRKVVGRYHRGRSGSVLKVEDKKFAFDFPVFSSAAKNLKEGDVVEGVIEGKSKEKNRRGVRIVRKIGKTSGVESITLSTIYLYGFEREFGSEIKRSVSSFPVRIRKNVPGRADLTNFPFVTIDGENARDFDDAVCLVKEGDNYRLLVSIADVSEYVEWDSPLDREAMHRGVSVYFPDRVIPMLPEVLSADLCSLREKVNRLTMTVDARINRQGEVIAASFYPSVIRSRKRLTYESVQAFLDGGVNLDPRGGLGRMIVMMQDLAAVLHEKRVREGSLDFDLPESRITISLGGDIEKVVEEERLFSHRIIEEFMLLANIQVAKHLDTSNVKFLYRIHERPDPLKLKQFFKFSSHFDRDFSGQMSLQDISLKKALEFVKDKPYEKIFNRVLLRSFKLARYSPENPGHFGLGFNTYTHFTSPIRRYPDLMVHRALKFTLGDKKYGKHLEVIEKDLARIGDHLSKREKDAEQAERDVVDKLKALYMVGREGEQHAGLITSVHPFGFFVALEDVIVEGLVHINDLPEDVYYMNSAGFTLAGRYFGKTFSVGNRVHISVKESDPLKGRVDFLLVEKGRQKKYNEVKTGTKRGKHERKNSYRRR